VQTPEEVKKISEDAGLDMIQLSGHEGWKDLDFYAPFAVINAEHVSPDSSSKGLLDVSISR
jgi:phosphoribosylanthranilate isomerase